MALAAARLQPLARQLAAPLRQGQPLLLLLLLVHWPRGLPRDLLLLLLLLVPPPPLLLPGLEPPRSCFLCSWLRCGLLPQLGMRLVCPQSLLPLDEWQVLWPAWSIIATTTSTATSSSSCCNCNLHTAMPQLLLLGHSHGGT